ncbi:hypothetical protein SAMN05428642_102335 [Flaviramulus basaltis]|uniref:Uncharacterized protein n=1 Tax=Flaviramulus basaltis TaxID=369401 RepID=A0A1K2IH67_9FLAO|nr:hypothetical protein [Flaviramulus basaltis]SFZ91796.1 hypothetical protein SAMN05428642_102335 [Flaviramulus basaltis]
MKLLLQILIITIPYQMFAQKTIPNSIKNEVHTALSYFPELNETKIEFKFKKNIKKSTMQAQPTFKSFFRNRKHRSYIILISEKFKITNQEFSTKDIPSDILIGWIGHELGHVMDYQTRSNLNLIWFGIKYLLSDSHIVEAERAADTFAVNQGMEDYILKTKSFILNHADISTTYKNRIKRFYLSPEEIMGIVNSRDVILETN